VLGVISIASLKDKINSLTLAMMGKYKLDKINEKSELIF
jgi:hypothetical protein